MKTLVPCPSCHRLLEPPLQASGSAKLRCPLCQFELLAYDLIQGAHRPWMVIEDPGGENLFRDFHAVEEVVEKPIRIEVSKDHDGEEYELVDETKLDETTHQGSVSTKSSSLKKEQPIQWERFKPLTHEEFQRRKRSAKSPLASLLQVVFGGLAAIPISLAILWYGLGKDVGGAAPWVAQYAPWLVPASLRPMGTANVDWQSRASIEEMGEGFQHGSKFDLPVEPADTQKPTDVGSTDGSNVEGSEAGTSPEFKAEEQSLGQSTEYASRDIDFGRVADACNRWRAAAQAWNDFEGSDTDTKRRLAQSYYASATDVASHMSRLDLSKAPDRQWMDRCHQILRDHAGQPSLLNLLDAGGKYVLSQEIGIGDGVGFIMDVESSSIEDGKMTVQLTTPVKISGQPVAVFAVTRPGAKEIEAGRSASLAIVDGEGTERWIRLLASVPIK